MPLRILRTPGLVSSSIVRGFLVTAMYSTFFLGTLYLEHIRHFGALETGLAYLPWTLTVAALSLGISARLNRRFGPMPMLVAGMLSVVVGLGLMTTVNAGTSFFPTIFFAFFAIGLGIGSAFVPLLSIAMANVPAADAGLASGIVNVSQQVSGALGLAVLGTIAANHTHALERAHQATVTSLIAGYHLAFTIGALCVSAGIVVAFVLLRAPRRTQPESAVAPGAGHRPRDRRGVRAPGRLKSTPSTVRSTMSHLTLAPTRPSTSARRARVLSEAVVSAYLRDISPPRRPADRRGRRHGV